MIYFKGTRILAKSKLIANESLQQYILVESNDSSYAFSLVCISGYKAGNIYGVINFDKSEACIGSIAVTKEHLISELTRNLGELVLYKIIEKMEVGIIANIEQIEITN